MPYGLLIATFAGCKILQDTYSDESRYRVVTVNDRCITETGSIDVATRCAEQFAKAFQCTTE